MNKYRIRLKNSRVIGPLSLEQFVELKQKGHIVGKEEYQIYPTGDWGPIDDFKEIKEVLKNDVKSEDNIEATFVRKIKDITNEKNNKGNAKEETEETSFPKKFEYEKKTPFSDRKYPVNTGIINPEDEKADLTLTKTISEKNSLIDENQDKTIVNTDTVKYLEELQRAKEEAESKKEEEKSELEPEVDLNNDATQFLNLNEFKKEVRLELKSNQEEFKEEEKEYNDELLKIENEKKARIEKEKLENLEEESEEEPSKLKKYLVVLAIIAVFYVILFPEETKKPVQKVIIKEPVISFPVRYDIPSEVKANELYKAGLIENNKNTYSSKIKASVLFRQSLENQFNNNPAAAKLIFLYSDLIKDSKDISDDANTVFKLVQIFKNKAQLDGNFAAGIALFYLNMEKYSAAAKVVEKFNAVKNNSPTLELFAVYLRSLIKNGDLVKAKSVADKLETTKLEIRSLYVQLALIDYYIFINEYEKGSKLVIDSLKTFKDSVPLLLKECKLLIYAEDFKTLNIQLKKIRALNVENSKIYYAKYLEYRALFEVSEGKVKEATALFKKALKTHESLELRSRLASLSESTNSEANIIIVESKALQLIGNAKIQLMKNNFRFAFKDALEANRIAPHFIPAKIFLAKLQTNQSLFKEAIAILENLYSENPHNEEIIFSLIDTYIEAYKFSDVSRILSIISSSEIVNNPKFYSITAKYYVYKDDFVNARAWLQRAINKNPLDDRNKFELAKMYIKYNKFDKGKSLLNNAMDLDPSQLDYRVSYSSILYDIDGADSAIGYLYDILQDFPDNPKLLSQIGIFYYRSGQIKSFKNIKEKLQKLPNKDTALYEFLIKAAELDGRPNDVIEYSKKLIELNPGDLKTRLNLGKTYMESAKYKEALIELKAIEDRLDTYPNLQLYMSKLFLLTDDYDQAEILAKKEIEANPSSEFGYILLGDIYSEKKQYIEGEKEYKKAQKINGNNYNMLIGLAKINFKKSQYELALDQFLKARNVAPEQPEVHKLLGDAYRKMSQSLLAIESYKLFLELSPTSKYKDEINTYIRMMQ